MVEAKANIASLRSKVDAEIRRVTSGVGVSSNITRQRVADVRASLEAQRAKVLRLKAVRDEGSVLLRDVESAQRAFEQVMQRFNQSSLESQNTQSNINLLTAATPPLEPSSPKIILNTALAIFLGLLLAVGVALLLELMDRRVRSVEDVAGALGRGRDRRAAQAGRAPFHRRQSAFTGPTTHGGALGGAHQRGLTMAKFRDSTVHEFQPGTTSAADSAPKGAVLDRSIGDIIAETRHLSAEQVEQILAHQRERGIRFGEAAIQLGFASTDDVLFALAQQFHYPYAPEEQRKLSPELVALNQPFSAQAESFRAIRSQLMMRLFNDQHESRRALAVVSPNSGDGKTFFAANLAVALAQLGGRTLIVDADLRGPRQHEVFKLTNNSGLSGILSGRVESQVVQQVPGVSSLFVLPVGITPPNPLELVERPAFGLLVRELVSKFDHVVVDTPAAEYGSDSAVIAARCGAALVLARKDASRVGALEDLMADLSQGSSKIAGVIVNEF